MPAITEPDRLGDLLKFEEDNLYSRDEITVEVGQILAAGAVIARRNTSGEILALNPGAGSGQGNAYGIIIEDVDASTVSQKSWIVARHAIVAEDAVIWPSGISTGQLDSAMSELRALGIILRRDA